MKLNQILTKLQKPIDSSYIKTKPVGGSAISFVSWFDYCSLLDERIGADSWQWEITNIVTTDDRLILTGKLTILGEDKSAVRMATGTEKLNCSSYGDPSSNAESSALRRTCAKFGLGRALWQKTKPKQSKSFNPVPVSRPVSKGEITREQWLEQFGQKIKLL